MGALTDIIQLIPGYDPVATAGDCHFDEEAAQLALDFFPECLRHVKGEKAGQPFNLETWQQAIVGNLFGWKRPDGTRRYRKAFILVGRKNGKTTWAAGIVLYVLFCDGEPGAEIYSAAADRDQASLTFSQAWGMVRQEPFLAKRATVYKGFKTIELNDNSGTYKPISSEANTKFGYNTHCAIVDEVHAHKTRDLIDALETSTGARRQPLVIYITTRDWDRPSICNEKQKYAEAVRDGRTKAPEFLPVLYMAGKEDDWGDEATWRKANPNLGVSLKLSDLQEKFKEAKEIPAFENTFRRLHLNQRTEQAERWLNMDAWDACEGEIDLEALRGQPCYGGLDLATTTDMAAFALYFPEHHELLCWFWVPKEGAEIRERRDHVEYLTWARQGLITLTEGNVIDYDIIRRDINTLPELYDIREINVDPWNATQIQNQLAEDGFTVVTFRQGYESMNVPMMEFARLVIGGELRHGGNPVLRWNASNVAVMTGPTNCIKPSKKHSTEKIDGIVAGAMAIGAALVAVKKPRSKYETQELTVLSGSV